MNGRAITAEQKRAIIERLYVSWSLNPQLRLGQLLCNAVGSDDIFYIEDEKLASNAERFGGKKPK